MIKTWIEGVRTLLSRSENVTIYFLVRGFYLHKNVNETKQNYLII